MKGDIRFFMFCHYVVCRLGKEIKIGVFLGVFSKKGGLPKTLKIYPGPPGPSPRRVRGLSFQPGRVPGWWRGLNL